MNHIDLGNPTPRLKHVTYEDHSYQFTAREYLLKPDEMPITPFFEVLDARRTRREFSPLIERDLASFLWCAARTQAVVTGIDGNIWQQRPAPSAGGRHPIDVFVFARGKLLTLSLYDSLSHSLGQLTAMDEELQLLDHQINEVVNSAHVTAIWFGAQFGRTIAKYEYADSLVWRDAGAMLTTMALTAEALDLNFCPLGITGEPFLSRSLRCGDKVLGVGGGLLGGKR